MAEELAGVLIEPSPAQSEIDALRAELAGAAPGSPGEAAAVDRLNEIISIMGAPYTRTVEEWRVTEGW